jgi:putative peptidoglycan lipid II flippase
MTLAAPVPAVLPAPDLARSTVAMTALTLVSRLTGFVRVLVVVAVLGDTFLGNTYQSANTVPNLLFELIAAGVLQAVVVPSLVGLFDQGKRHEAEHVVGSVLGLATAGLAVVAGIGALLAPFVMRVLVSGVESDAVRDDAVRLGTVLLWFFLPQVVCYAAAMVSTGVLNAQGRFTLPVFAPVLNNVVVTASYVLFWVLRDGKPPSFDLSAAETLVLAGGTTLGVLAFCAVPVIGVLRSGFRLRPRLDARHPEVRRLARLGGWAAAYLASTQVLLLVLVVLAGGIEGGVVVYAAAWTFFLLPHALFALPVVTALYPSLARTWGAGDRTAYGRTVGSGLRAIAFLALPATAALVALARPVSSALVFGEGRGSVGAVASATAAFAAGLVGYGAFLFLTRASYATGDARTPALVNVGAVLLGAVAMGLLGPTVDDGDRVAVLAACHSAAYVVGAVVLLVLVGRRSPGGLRLGRPVAVGVVAAALAGTVMWAADRALPSDGRLDALLTLAVGGVLGLGTYVGASALLGGIRPSAVPALLRGQG